MQLFVVYGKFKFKKTYLVKDIWTKQAGINC